MPTSRRDFVATASAATVCALWTQGALAGDADWLVELEATGRALREGEITADAWVADVDALTAKVGLEAILSRTNFAALTRKMELPDDRAGVRRLRIPAIEEGSAGLILKIFGIKKGRALVPHGHNGIASTLLVIAGELRGRHFDRVLDERKHLVVRPVEDATHVRGKMTSSTRETGNVHWFEAQTDAAFAVGISLSGLDAHRPGRVYVDPDAAQAESGGLLRMPILNPRTAFRRYGNRSKT